MSKPTNHSTKLSLDKFKIWVLAPHLESCDPNIEYYYDFTQSIAEYTKVFDELNVKWVWQPITMQDYKQVIFAIASTSNGIKPLIINLCDGDEVNGVPGVSIIHELEKQTDVRSANRPGDDVAHLRPAPGWRDARCGRGAVSTHRGSLGNLRVALREAEIDALRNAKPCPAAQRWFSRVSRWD